MLPLLLDWERIENSESSPSSFSLSFIRVHCSLASIRAKVWMARTTSTLFDVKQYCTDIEHLFYKVRKGEKREGWKMVDDMSISLDVASIRTKSRGRSHHRWNCRII